MGVSAIAVETTENAKLGLVSATYASQSSCPRSCPFYKNGCYAEYGPLGIQTRRLNGSSQKDLTRIATQEAAAIDRLSGDRLLRLHVVGDASTNKAAKILGDACARYTRRARVSLKKKVWGYTHAWRDVKRSSWGESVSMLVSVESVAEAEKAMGEGYAVALVVKQFLSEKAYRLGEVKVLPCPYQTRGIQCRDCRLCLDDRRLLMEKMVIGFEPHGNGFKRVRDKLVD